MQELTDRENLILLMLADGSTVDEISKEIDRKRDTVKHLLSQIREKLGAKNNVNAVALAYHRGILNVRLDSRSDTS